MDAVACFLILLACSWGAGQHRRRLALARELEREREFHSRRTAALVACIGRLRRGEVALATDPEPDPDGGERMAA